MSVIDRGKKCILGEEEEIGCVCYIPDRSGVVLFAGRDELERFEIPEVNDAIGAAAGQEKFVRVELDAGSRSLVTRELLQLSPGSQIPQLKVTIFFSV